MHDRLFETFAVLFVLDLLVRPWLPAKEKVAGNAIYLALAYGPAAAVSFVPPSVVAAMVALIGVGACLSWTRMTGLHEHPRFALPALGIVALSAPVALVGSLRLVVSIPVLALLLVIAAASMKSRTDAFLQKLCLSWVGVLAFGWLWSASVVLLRGKFQGYDGAALLLVAIACTKAADTLWAAWRRVFEEPWWMQLVLSVVGGAAGGLALGGTTNPKLDLLGAACGAGLGFGARAHDLIVEDVTGSKVARSLKSTMLFGAAFSFGLAALVIET